jgi:hypothetical protein
MLGGLLDGVDAKVVGNRVSDLIGCFDLAFGWPGWIFGERRFMSLDIAWKAFLMRI